MSSINDAAVPELCGARVVLRPTVPADVEVLRVLRATPEVVRWWGMPDQGSAEEDPDATCLTVLVDREIAGLIQFSEEAEPDYRHAAVDIFIAPDLHSRGLGTDAIVTLVDHLIRTRGHHRVTIDPAAENAAAIRCYEKAGFRPVGVMRRAWRDPSGSWRDQLLMELVTPAPPALEHERA